MALVPHRTQTGLNAAHPPFYPSESDPGTLLEGYRGWFKPSTEEIWIRNAANTGWHGPYTVGSGSGSVSAATEGAAGIAELATQTETDTGTDDGRIVTPLKAATRYLAKAGGTLTGFLTLHADPTSAMHPATKQYADALVGGGASPASESTAGIAEIATQTETNAGTDDARIVTPLKLATRTSTETRAGVVELATDAETQTGTDTARAITPANLSARSATETRAGVAEVATQAETNTGTDDAKMVTPAKFAGRTSTDTRAGVVELATDAETQTGTDTARAITPANLSARTATETRSGTAEIATQGETDTGTDDTRIVTPLKAATRFLAKAGGTLTGFLTLHADPTSALHAVTKQYADGLVSGGASPASETVAGIAEIATQDETDAGTDDARIVTPLKLANYSGLGGGGSGNISGAYDIEAGTYTDAGMSDEFASGTLDAQWNTATSSGTIDFPGQPASSVYDLTTRSGTLLLQPLYSTSASQFVSLRQADSIDSGESLVVSCALPHVAKDASATHTYFGIYLNTSTTSFSTGTYNAFRLIVNDTGTSSNAASVVMLTNGGTQRALATSLAATGRVYLRTSRKTINSIDSFVWMYSHDGVVWTPVWQNTASNFTQMYLVAVVNTQTNPSIAPVFPVNWVRHVPSTAHDPW